MKEDLTKRVQKLEENLEKMQDQIRHTAIKRKESSVLYKLLSISDVLNADSQLRYIVVGTLYNAMVDTGIVDVNNCDEIRTEFKQFGWIPLSKDDVPYTPYREWEWYTISVIFRVAAEKARNVAHTIHNYNCQSQNPAKSSAELIDEFDKITKIL